jgi:hypothetical protein
MKMQPHPHMLQRLILALELSNMINVVPACTPSIMVTREGKLPANDSTSAQYFILSSEKSIRIAAGIDCVNCRR